MNTAAHYGVRPMTIQDQKIEASNADPIVSQQVALQQQLFRESDAMARYALSNGLEVQPQTIENLAKITGSSGTGTVDQSVIKSLATLHQALAKVVYPATPRAIALLDEEKAKQLPFYFLGPVPLIRRLSGVAILFLMALLSTSLSQEVNVENINMGLLQSNNHVLFLNQLFLLCCAGLGAAFSCLFQANSFIAKATYDPRYDSSYWSRIILGVIAGIIIVELLPASLFNEGTMKSFGKPTLAMLGGFSASVVYRILQRLVDALETVVKGNGSQTHDQEIALNQVKASEHKTQVNADTAAKLVGLMKDVEGMDKTQISGKLNDFVKDLLPSATPTETTQSPATPK